VLTTKAASPVVLHQATTLPRLSSDGSHWLLAAVFDRVCLFVTRNKNCTYTLFRLGLRLVCALRFDFRFVPYAYGTRTGGFRPQLYCTYCTLYVLAVSC
jgi:hypothetical protein